MDESYSDLKMTDNISILVKKSSQFMKIGGWDLISVEIHLGLK